MTVPPDHTLSRIALHGRRHPCEGTETRKGTETCEGTE